MIGSAPGARIFPIKVFAAGSLSTPTSRTIAAMEAAIDLRQKFDAGEPGGLNIQVANLSLGGPTNAAARTLSDETVEAMLNADIVPAIAAGNEGFSSVTIGSPGTSFAALTVGSRNDGAARADLPRAVLGAMQHAPLATVLACAQAWRPDMNVQISEFSSRGPTHDGRVDPDVVANGSFNFSQGSGTSPGTVSFGSGTSYATPTVAGIAAVLRQSRADCHREASAQRDHPRRRRRPRADGSPERSGCGVRRRGARARSCWRTATCPTST